MKLYLSLQLRGKKSPLDFRPTLDEVIDWYLMAFRFLSKSRQWNISPQPILIAEMFSLVNGIGCIGMFEEFIYIIQEIDSAYISEIVKRKEGQDG